MGFGDTYWKTTAQEIADAWEPIYKSSSEEEKARHAKILSDLDGAKIVLALIENYGYEESAIVVYEKDGRLYETNGSHCSCYGFEGTWSPEETSMEALRMRKLYFDVSSDIDGLIAAYPTPTQGSE